MKLERESSFQPKTQLSFALDSGGGVTMSPSLGRQAGAVWDAQKQQAAWSRSAPDLGAMEGKGFFWVEVA